MLDLDPRRCPPRARAAWPRQLAAALLALALAGALAACSDDDGGGSARPAPPVTGADVDRFDGLPHPPRSEPLGPREDLDGVLSRSYRVTGLSPEQVMEFYAAELPKPGQDWTPAGAIERPGVGSLRQHWRSASGTLTVSANSGETLGQEDPSNQVHTQYSLVYDPRST